MPRKHREDAFRSGFSRCYLVIIPLLLPAYALLDDSYNKAI